MSNFSPKIEDSTQEELLNNINEHSPNFGIISSNELLRREIKKLTDTIKNFNEKSSRQSEVMLFLTYLIAFLTIIMVLGLTLQIYITIK